MVLRQSLGYCWSVAVVVLPVKGKKLMERWFGSGGRDIRWIMRENLRKNRLARMDAKWVEYPDEADLSHAERVEFIKRNIV